MEVFVGSETLRDERGADDLAVAVNDETAGCLVMEQDGGETGEEQRIAKAEDQRRDQREEDGSLPDGVQKRNLHARLSPERAARRVPSSPQWRIGPQRQHQVAVVANIPSSCKGAERQ